MDEGNINMSGKHIAIHGHFYQPPRDNPWLGLIDKQKSAYPFHDWNERINRECYHPNAFSRILGREGRIQDLVLNYKYINFNIGPTLMDWIAEHDHALYEKILEADKESRKIFNGHGNAIAQVYNHVIMPLANHQDRVTQIEWGIAHFKKHFKRNPESMWLAETAINYEVVEHLIDYGMTYVILSPTQAEKIRPLNSDHWLDVSNNNIDTSRPYRIYTNHEKGRFLDVFFYNQDISIGISFNHYLRDAHKLADEFQKFMHKDESKIITACTDGESYGHHEHFGDMCLAYFIEYICDERGFKFTNFADYLEGHPPMYEVVLKQGHNNRGTAWSCAHGVERWNSNCGCSTGGYSHWHQKWRGPLREAFDYLRDTIEVLYEKKLEPYFKDVWDARDKYIEVILDYSDQARDKFLEKYSKKNDISKKEKDMIFCLLEAQKNLLLMYTSCGWFFADVAGIEPVQNMKYALMAIHLVSPYLKNNLLDSYLKKLELAEGNLEFPSNGKEAFELYVTDCVVDVKEIAANFIIVSHLGDGKNNILPNFYCIKENENKIVIKDNITGKEYEFKYYLFAESIENLKCYILDNDPKLEKELLAGKRPKDNCYGISNLKIKNTDDLLMHAMKHNVEYIEKMTYDLYVKNKSLIDLFIKNDVALPPMMKDICSHYITQTILKKIDNLDLAGLKRLFNEFAYAPDQNIIIHEERLEKKMLAVIIEKLEAIYKNPTIDGADQIIKLMQIKEEIGINIPTYFLEEKIFSMLDYKPFVDKKRFYQKFLKMAEFFNI